MTATVNKQRRINLNRVSPEVYEAIVVLNTAAALIVAGRVDDLAAGAARAVDAIDSGAAKDTLRALVAITNEAAPGD